jgi:hypothetical protein
MEAPTLYLTEVILRAVQRSYFFAKMVTRAGVTYLDAYTQEPPQLLVEPSSSDDRPIHATF